MFTPSNRESSKTRSIYLGAPGTLDLAATAKEDRSTEAKLIKRTRRNSDASGWRRVNTYRLIPKPTSTHINIPFKAKESIAKLENLGWKDPLNMLADVTLALESPRFRDQSDNKGPVKGRQRSKTISS